MLLPAPPDAGISHYRHRGAGSACHFIGGYLRCDQRFNPLPGMLPPLLLVRRRGDRVVAGPPPSGDEAVDEVREPAEADWLENMLRFATGEATGRRPGCAAIPARLSEVLFLETLRCYVEHLPAQPTGWLAGGRDPEAGRALRLLHEHSERRWTVADLAQAVGRSRSVLARRFVDLVEQPPMHDPHVFMVNITTRRTIFSLVRLLVLPAFALPCRKRSPDEPGGSSAYAPHKE